jgi:hypothetical protein
MAETTTFKMPVIPDDYSEQLKRMGLPSYWEENKNRDPRYQWIHPYAEVRPKPQYKGGMGLFATKLIMEGEQYFNGEFMADGLGEVVDIDTLNTWPIDKQMLFLHWCAQISPTEILSPRLDEEGKPEDFGAYINHSCDPNIMFHDASFNMIVRRDIHPDEEITIDYGQYMTSETCVKEFKDTQCGCGKASCRGHVTWKDHLNPELIKRYGNNWPPHAIESQKKHGVLSQA